MATTDQLRKAERRDLGPIPPVNSFSRDDWCKIVRAMDLARFGKLRSLITGRHTKADLYAIVARRISEGEAFPSRSEWQSVS